MTKQKHWIWVHPVRNLLLMFDKTQTRRNPFRSAPWSIMSSINNMVRHNKAKLVKMCSAWTLLHAPFLAPQRHNSSTRRLCRRHSPVAVTSLFSSLSPFRSVVALSVSGVIGQTCDVMLCHVVAVKRTPLCAGRQTTWRLQTSNTSPPSMGCTEASPRAWEEPCRASSWRWWTKDHCWTSWPGRSVELHNKTLLYLNINFTIKHFCI